MSLERTYEVLRDPVKAEWVVVADSRTKGDDFLLPVHPYKDFARNAELADRIVDLLHATPDPSPLVQPEEK